MARKKKNLPPKKKKEKPPVVWEWSGDGWTARIIDHPDDEGWALSMTRDGDDEPVQIVPWVMGRNKKDPKPLNEHDFRTQLKAAKDFLIRRENQRRAAFRKSFTVYTANDEPISVVFDVIPDEFEPEGVLTATDAMGDELARHTLPPGFKLTRTWAKAWVADGLPRPQVG